ncbi:uncharacterized protein LOC6546172 isoform X2 [Drosophila erecta]|uniref:uncharacterized protein LOC6546172 isoform X2 n=1 Tax=Drosophila erecta TaxID=7220 RepID=UPI000F048281|nr:uncharacterized protein LOC6546172 isoform X2 [Drosophila erecta]
MENQRTLSDLPFDVLDLIFEELESIVDKVQLAQVDEKLGAAFGYHSRSAYKKLSPYYRLTPEMLVVLVRLCGSTIEEFTCRRMWNGPWSDIVAKSVVQHCPNLKSVRIDVDDDNCDSVQSFLKKMSKLLVSAELNLLTSNPKKIFDSITEMTHMTKLKCRGNITEDVTNITIMPSEQPHSMIWPELEVLKLNNCEIFTELPECPKLKTLDMINCNCHIEGLLFGFILQNGVNIEKMNENCSPPPFDGDNFLQVLRSCPKLRKFYTPMKDIKIYQDFVSSIVETLKENGVKQEEPFKLIIYSRAKLKWIRRLIPRTSSPDLIALDYLYDFFY